MTHRRAENDSPSGVLGPSARMPLRAHGQTRKRWRYVGVFADGLMFCAARAQVGPLWQSFWVLWDRGEGRRYDGTRLRPGSREVQLAGDRIVIEAREVRASLVLGEATPIEARCPSGSGWGWTRKRCGVPVRGTVEAGGRRWDLDALAVDDESAGYHRRHTSWLWSAGVGEAEDGRAVAWNLVEGINDPPRGSERAIWTEGEPAEPLPVSFDGLERIEFDDGSQLGFAAECERARRDNLLLVRSSYRLRFGRFSGSLNGVPLAGGLGVMEEHDAHW
jgi:Protein of unknown function (DUF2804)